MSRSVIIPKTNPKAWTATLDFARKIADQALADPEGITLTFLSEHYGSFELAGRAARRFQTTFSAMRSKARRAKQQHLGERSAQLDSNISHNLDCLSAMRDPLPDYKGWTIKVIPAQMIELGVIVTSNSTGKIIEEFDPISRSVDLILDKLWREREQAAKEHRPCSMVISHNDHEFMLKHVPDWLDTLRNVFGIVLTAANSPLPTQAVTPSVPPLEPAPTPDARLDAMEAEFFGEQKP